MTRRRNPTITASPSDRTDPAPNGPRLERDRTEVVYRELRAAIVARRLPPGARLPEAQLADVFGVSRTLVRQALQRLVHDRLAVQAPNRSVRVAAPSIEEVHHLYEVRRLLECAMIAAAARPSRTDLAALKRTVALEAGANAAGDTQRAMQLADAFHLELAAAIGNPVLVDILRELIARGNVAIALYEQPGRAICRCQEHGRILKQLAAGAHPEAADEMRAHLTGIEDHLVVHGAVRPRLELGQVFPHASHALVKDPR